MGNQLGKQVCNLHIRLTLDLKKTVKAKLPTPYTRGYPPEKGRYWAGLI